MTICRKFLLESPIGTFSLSSVINMKICKGFLQGHVKVISMEEIALVKAFL